MYFGAYEHRSLIYHLFLGNECYFCFTKLENSGSVVVVSHTFLRPSCLRSLIKFSLSFLHLHSCHDQGRTMRARPKFRTKCPYEPHWLIPFNLCNGFLTLTASTSLFFHECTFAALKIGKQFRLKNRALEAGRSVYIALATFLFGPPSRALFLAGDLSKLTQRSVSLCFF
jgi:hypothetical protein